MRLRRGAQLGEADTWLEVGAWAWNWMEPPLGTISFFLLCVQYVRDKRIETGRQGALYEYLKDKQGDLLIKQYGDKYDPDVLYAYGASVALKSDADVIDREHACIVRRVEQSKAVGS